MGNQFFPREQPVIVKNQWICAEFMLKHNTVYFDNLIIAREYIGPAGK